MTMGTHSTACVDVVSLSARWVMVRETHEVVENLVTDDARHLEALLASDRVDNHVAMDTDKVLRVKN